MGGKAEDCELELGVAVGRVHGFLVEKLGGGMLVALLEYALVSSTICCWGTVVERGL